MHRLPSFVKNWNLRSDNCLLPSSFRRFSTGSATESATTFALSYLINECGVHPKLAATAAEYVRFETPDNANAVLRFFRNLGFSGSQIPKIIGRNPRLLMCDPEERVAPKIRFLESNGFSASDITRILLIAPETLHCSVERKLLPNLNFIKSVIPSEEKAIGAITRGPFLLTCEPETYLIPNIKVLRESGVGESTIIRLLHLYPLTMLMSPSRLSEAVQRVKELGISPKLVKFGHAIKALIAISKETWESKIEAYKKCGWSEEVALRAFTKFPLSMTLSEKKIMENMEYYVNQMGFDALAIANRPVVLSFSLKKRIVPRDSVLQVLVSKGLIKSRAVFIALMVDDELFRSRFVAPYKEEAPELSDLLLKMGLLAEPKQSQ